MRSVIAASVPASYDFGNNPAMAVIVSIAVGYLIGCISLSYFIAKLKGFDIRKHGSGNAGASNVIITVGKKAGAFVAIFDIFKAYFAIQLTVGLFGNMPIIGTVTGVAVILGHIFPFYMGFKGGKGFASLGGTILAMDYRMFFVFLIFAIFVVFISNYVCFGPTSVSALFPFAYGYIYRESGGVYAMFILLIATIAIIYRHLENFRRIKEGNELKFSFLWNRKAEADRFGVENDDGTTYPFELEHEDGYIKHKEE